MGESEAIEMKPSAILGSLLIPVARASRTWKPVDVLIHS